MGPSNPAHATTMETVIQPTRWPSLSGLFPLWKENPLDVISILEIMVPATWSKGTERRSARRPGPGGAAGT
jgi:hypothetical protein